MNHALFIVADSPIYTFVIQLLCEVILNRLKDSFLKKIIGLILVQPLPIVTVMKVTVDWGGKKHDCSTSTKF